MKLVILPKFGNPLSEAEIINIQKYILTKVKEGKK
jgi:hypothetical protein